MTLSTLEGGDGTPQEPDWSQVYSDVLDIVAAHEQWGAVLREMRDAQTLAVANGHMIERLIRFRVEFDRAAREVAEHGTVMKAKRTRVPQVNPFWGVMRQSSEEIRVLEVELGLPPVRRNKAGKVQRGKKAARPADAYLKAVPR